MMLGDLSKMVESVIISPSNPREEEFQALLYQIRQQLSRLRITLSMAILKLFEYQKEKFTKDQLAQLFESIGLRINAEQLSIMMQNLDPDDNKVVFVAELNKVIGAPLSQSRLNASSIIMDTAWVQQLANILRSSGPYQTLQLFDDDSDGNLTVSELTMYIESAELEVDRKIISKLFFKGNTGTIPISEILRIVGIRPEEQFCQRDDKSEKCSLLELSINFDKPKSELRMSKISSKAELIRQYINPYGDLEEPLTSMAVMEINANRIFIDKSNPGIKPGLTYKHSKEIFRDHYFLFELQKSVIRKGMGTIMDSRNIIQGKGKDCYLLSAVAGLVELYPQFIYRLFVLDKNPSDIYGVRLFIDGQWQTIILDAHFPVDQRGILYYAKPYRSEIWVLLLEKAWAKAFNSFENIESGNPQQGLTALTGAPCVKITGEDPRILDKLRFYLKSNYIVTANTSEIVSTMDKAQQKALGIYENHAYTVVGLYQNIPYMRDGKPMQITLIRMRNPWGKGAWKGDWSFDSNLWTPQLRKKLNYMKDLKNGTFYIGIGDFLTMFGSMKICQLSPINVNTSLRVTCKRKELTAIKVIINEPGTYFFSIYQQSERKAKADKKVKHTAISHIFLSCRSQTGGLIPVISKTYNREKTHIEAVLNPGQYIVHCRLKWQNQEDSFVFGTYGPAQVQLSRIQGNYKNILEYVLTKAQEQRGEITTYELVGHPECYKVVSVSIEEGIGYVTLVNKSRQQMRTEVRFNNARGIKALKPGDIPIRVTVQPQCAYTQCLLVEPKGRFTLDESVEFV